MFSLLSRNDMAREDMTKGVIKREANSEVSDSTRVKLTKNIPTKKA